MTSEHINLLEKYLAESLSESEKEQLLNLLSTSEEFKTEFNEALDTKALLYNAINDQALVIETMEKIAEVDKGLENRIMQTIPKKKNYSAMRIFKITAAAALIIFIFKLSSEKISTVASIGMSPETVINRENGKVVNTAKLLVNDTIQTGSADELISFKDGSKIDLKSKSELKLISKHPKVFKLNKGTVSAEVTPQDKPMRIETSSAIIEVLGTVFRLSSQEKSSLLKVSRGKVAITDKKTGERVIVNKGEYTIAEGKDLNIRQGKGPLFVSDTINSSSSKRYIDIEVDLTGERQLILITSNGGDTNNLDQTAWLNPVLNINGRWSSLTKIKPKLIKVGSGSLETYPENIKPQQLMLNGKSYVRGFYSHATSVLIWDLPKGTKMLKCRGAILDTALTGDNNFSAKFEVYTEISKDLLDLYLQNKENF
ncbi:MAG: FecR domain-containing protein [Lentisphaeraceae bacterium]|nr:FecR domain-containing protein [Lentisphaeraceae bacterium]